MPVPKPHAALDVQFTEALAFFRRKSIVTPDEWQMYDSAAKRRAFTVAGITQRDILHDVWKAMDRAIADGTDFKTFQKEVGEKLEAAWGGSVANPAWRLETIFRTNIQTAYNHGRVEMAMRPDVRAVRPLWQFNAIDDGRTTHICRQCDGTILPPDDAWWQSHVPPLHFACRSGFITLTTNQALERGGQTKSPANVPAGKGFGDFPELDDIDAVAEEKNKQLPEPLRPSGSTPKPRTSPRAEPRPPAPPPDAPGAPPGQTPPSEPPDSPPPSPRMGGRWEPGNPRSIIPASAPTAPWRTGNEALPPGRDFEQIDAGASFDKDALGATRLFREQGNDLYPLRRSNFIKGPDATIAVEPPPGRLPPFPPGSVPPNRLVEFKRLKPPPGKITRLRKVLLDLKDSTSRAGQARNIVIDAILAGWTVAEAMALEPLIAADAPLRARLDFVRIVGPDFDVTHYFEPTP